MQRLLSASLSLCGFAPGCGGTVISDCDPGPRVTYPFDGVRTWEYRSDGVPDHDLVATSDGVPEQRGGVNVYRVPFAKRCGEDAVGCVEGELFQAISWSSDAQRGVAVHAVDAGAGPTDLQPPVVLSPDLGCELSPTATTEVDGVIWTVSRAERPACPVVLGDVTLDDCFEIEVEVDAGSGAPLAGTWWSAHAFGVVAFQRSGESAVWELSDIDCAGDCDGTW
jgi:hypothetical protein